MDVQQRFDVPGTMTQWQISLANDISYRPHCGPFMASTRHHNAH